MKDAVTYIILGLGTILGAGGTVALIRALATRKLTSADVAGRLSDSTLKWVEQFQEEATAARKEAADMRREAAEARREASEARSEWRVMRIQMQREMQELVEQFRRVRAAVWAPTATIERVRTVMGDMANGAQEAPKHDDTG